MDSEPQKRKLWLETKHQSTASFKGHSLPFLGHLFSRGEVPLGTWPAVLDCMRHTTPICNCPVPAFIFPALSLSLSVCLFLYFYLSATLSAPVAPFSLSLFTPCPCVRIGDGAVRLPLFLSVPSFVWRSSRVWTSLLGSFHVKDCSVCRHSLSGYSFSRAKVWAWLVLRLEPSAEEKESGKV